jgi:hypothetical protein
MSVVGTMARIGALVSMDSPLIAAENPIAGWRRGLDVDCPADVARTEIVCSACGFSID